MDGPDDLSPARRRVTDSLKIEGASTATELASRLGLTSVAIRQHLQGLEETGLVTSTTSPAAGRGRPSQLWRLTPRAMSLFPDRHGELTVGLIEAIREAVGDDALDRVVSTRGAAQMRRYRELLPDASASLGTRVEALAAQRSREGYMAEVRGDGDDGFLLVENHCPICEAATSCMSLCRVELDVFQAALGSTADVERVSHLLDGDERCVYRIRAR